MDSSMNEKNSPGDRCSDPSCCPPEGGHANAAESCCAPGSGAGSRGSSRMRLAAFAVIVVAAVSVAAWSLLRDHNGDTAGAEVRGAYEIADLAPGMEFAFVLLAGEDKAGAEDVAAVVEGAAETLVTQGVQMGFCTVEAGSPVHVQLADSLGIEVFPAVVLMGESCGQSVVSGEITQDELLRTYLLATCGTGCGTGSACCPQ